jgi:cytochrome c-type biogenesis protein CcmH/NrfF
MAAMSQPRSRCARLIAAFLFLGTGLGTAVGTASFALPAGARAQGMATPAPVDQTSDADLELNRRARALTDQMMSPWCKGVTVTQCSSGIAVGYRNQVRAWLEAGISEADIKRSFTQQFGEGQLAMPRGGFSWTAPLIILGVGALALLILVRRLTMTPPESASGPQLSPDQYRKLEAELDSELRRRKLDD